MNLHKKSIILMNNILNNYLINSVEYKVTSFIPKNKKCENKKFIFEIIIKESNIFKKIIDKPSINFISILITNERKFFININFDEGLLVNYETIKIECDSVVSVLSNLNQYLVSLSEAYYSNKY